MIKEVKMYQTSDGKTFTDKRKACEHEESLTKTYGVTLYYRATYSTTIEATSEEEALKIAKEEWYLENLDIELEDYDIEEEENMIDDDDEEEGD